MNDLEATPGAVKALHAEREDHRHTKRRLTSTRQQLQEAAAEVSRLQIQMVRLSAENGRLGQLEAVIERRDQTIAGLRQALENRKEQIHV